MDLEDSLIAVCVLCNLKQMAERNYQTKQKQKERKKERKELSLFTQNIVVVAFVASVVQINDIVESHLGRN